MTRSGNPATASPVPAGGGANRHRYSGRRTGSQSFYVDGLRCLRPNAHLPRRIANIGKLIHLLSTVAIARYSTSDAPGVIRKPAVADVWRPGSTGVGDGVYLLGIAGAHGDAAGALEVAVDLVVPG